MSPDVYIPVLVSLLSGSLIGAVVALRKDRRDARLSDTDLATKIRELANGAVSDAEKRLERMEKRIEQMEKEREEDRALLTDERRRSQALEQALSAAGIAIPPWPPETHTDEEHLSGHANRRHHDAPHDGPERRRRP